MAHTGAQLSGSGAQLSGSGAQLSGSGAQLSAISAYLHTSYLGAQLSASRYIYHVYNGSFYEVIRLHYIGSNVILFSSKYVLSS